MFDRTVTLFNYHKTTNKWYGTVFTGCSLTDSYSSQKSSLGLNAADNINITIHAKTGKIVESKYGKKQFVSPKEYQRLEEVNDVFSFTSETDFFVMGEVEDLLIDDSDTENGLYNYMNAEYDSVFMVTNWAWYTMIPHFVVGGR